MTLYEEAGLAQDASPDQVRSAHKRLARIFHPDLLHDPDLRPLAEAQMRRLNAVFEVLSDPGRRAAYDATLRAPLLLPAPARRLTLSLASLPWLIAASAVIYAVVGLPPPPAPPRALPQPAPSQAARPPVVRSNRPPDSPREPRRSVSVAPPGPGEPREPDAPPLVTDGPPLAAAPLTAAAAAPAVVPDPPAPPARRGLTGAWMYWKPSSRDPAAGDQYPPEYIEMSVREQGATAEGRFYGRYRVADRPISPEVRFHFVGPAGGTLAWKGNGGASGELRLALLDENTLRIDWMTTQSGPDARLTAGTAVLIRRRDP